MNKIPFFENIKITCVISVIITHAMMQTLSSVPSFSRVYIIQASYLMQILFFISGYFVPYSYTKRGAKDFLKTKFIRLGIPILFFLPVFLCFRENIGVLYFWYTESLLFFCCFYVLFKCLFKTHSLRYKQNYVLILMIICAFLMGIVCYFARMSFPIGRWIHFIRLVSVEPAHYIQYVIMFVIGVFFNKSNWFSSVNDKMLYAIVSVGLLSMFGVAFAPLASTSLIFCIIEGFCALFFSIGSILIFKKLFNSSNAVMTWLGSNSYAAYVIHGIPLLSINSLLCVLRLGSLTHTVLLIIFSLFFTYLFASLIRKIPGVKSVLG